MRYYDSVDNDASGIMETNNTLKMLTENAESSCIPYPHHPGMLSHTTPLIKKRNRDFSQSLLITVFARGRVAS